MNLQTPISQTAKVVSGGRIQLPASFRHALGIKDGDDVVIALDGGQIVVRPYREVIRRIQERLRPYAPTDGTLVSEELIAERRAESERE